MAIFLVLLLAGGVIWQLSRVVGRVRALGGTPAPTTPLEYRRFNALLETDVRVRPDWDLCPVCECPTFDRAGDYPGCQLCGWENGPSSDNDLERARSFFAEHGTAHAPEESAAWGAKPLSRQEREHVRLVVALHRRACSGELDFPSWESQTLEHLQNLRRSEPS